MEKLKEFLKKLNESGIPLPTIRDPKTGRGSITLTMFWIAFNVALLTLAGKMVDIIGDVDYSNVLWLFAITGSFYLGRKFQGDGKNIDFGGEINTPTDKEPED